MNALPTAKKRLFISLRWKILMICTILFTVGFGATYNWFYKFTKEREIKQLQSELKNTIQITASNVDVNGLMTLCAKGEVNNLGTSDFPEYAKQFAWINSVHRLLPRAWPYLFVRGNAPECQRNGKPLGSENEIIYLVDSGTKDNPLKSTKFLDRDIANPWYIKTLEQGRLQIRLQPYRDRWGYWVSAYAPLKNSSGKVVAGIGLDISADYILELEGNIRQTIALAFIVTYGTMFILIYIITGVFTRPLIDLTKVAKRIGEGDYNQKHINSYFWLFPDEVNSLHQVFEFMLDKVRHREENLKVQIADLRIEIDEVKREKQVKEIVEADYFQDLQAKAKLLRNRSRPSPENESSERSPQDS